MHVGAVSLSAWWMLSSVLTRCTQSVIGAVSGDSEGKWLSGAAEARRPG